MVYLHKTDVVAIQESKKEECSKRFLDSLTTQINWWITQPSNGSSGREILGVDDSKFYILGHWKYSFSFYLKNKTDSQTLVFTSVYGPTGNEARDPFWAELRSLRAMWNVPWVIGGYFNAIIKRGERGGVTLNTNKSRGFFKMIHDIGLNEIKLGGRLYTWARGGLSMALLERFFTDDSWDLLHPNCTVSLLPWFISDHNPLVLHIPSQPQKNPKKEKRF